MIATHPRGLLQSDKTTTAANWLSAQNSQSPQPKEPQQTSRHEAPTHFFDYLRTFISQPPPLGDRIPRKDKKAHLLGAALEHGEPVDQWIKAQLADKDITKVHKLSTDPQVMVGHLPADNTHVFIAIERTENLTRTQIRELSTLADPSKRRTLTTLADNHLTQEKLFTHPARFDLLHFNWPAGATRPRSHDYLTDVTPLRSPLPPNVLAHSDEDTPARHSCNICGATSSDGATLHIDHVTPLSSGGDTSESTSHFLCEACQRQQRAHTDRSMREHAEREQKAEFAHKTKSTIQFICDSLQSTTLPPRSESRTLWSELPLHTRALTLFHRGQIEMYSGHTHDLTVGFTPDGQEDIPLHSLCEMAIVLAARRCLRGDPGLREDDHTALVRHGRRLIDNTTTPPIDALHTLIGFVAPDPPADTLLGTIATQSFAMMLLACWPQAIYHSIRAHTIDHKTNQGTPGQLHRFPPTISFLEFEALLNEPTTLRVLRVTFRNLGAPPDPEAKQNSERDIRHYAKYFLGSDVHCSGPRYVTEDLDSAISHGYWTTKFDIPIITADYQITQAP